MEKKSEDRALLIPVPPLSNESKPHSRHELRETEIRRRLTLVNKEFSEGLKFISKYDKAVIIFGSSRLHENNPYYIKAQSLAKKFAEKGFTIVTGAGPGIMEAANRGASEVDPKKSVGLNITLPVPQMKNKYVGENMDFYYFFSRKVMMSYAADAYIYFPGGFGTLDEFFEIITLVQTKKIRKVPMFLVGDDYWKSLDNFIRKKLLVKHEAVREDEVALYTITENDDEMIRVAQDSWEAAKTGITNTGI